MNATYGARVDRLRAFTEYGPEYRRGVADALADARVFHERGEQAACEHYILCAEQAAGMLSWEEFVRADPLGRTHVEVLPGSVCRYEDDGPEPDDTRDQRDRVRAAMLNSTFSWPDGRIIVRRARGPMGDLPIALGLLVITGVLPTTCPRPRGRLELDGSIVETDNELGASTLRELVASYAGGLR